MEFRHATPDDVDQIAMLHADSWRAFYRGAYLDSFLDGDVLEDRHRVWSQRLLHEPDPLHDTVVAESVGHIVGFVHTILDHDAEWGALLDNLHVRAAAHGKGVGTRLMAWSAEAVLKRGADRRLYLKVLAENRAAQRFYDARGGVCAARETSTPAGGGTILGLIYVWPDPSILVRSETRRLTGGASEAG